MRQGRGRSSRCRGGGAGVGADWPCSPPPPLYPILSQVCAPPPSLRPHKNTGSLVGSFKSTADAGAQWYRSRTWQVGTQKKGVGNRFQPRSRPLRHSHIQVSAKWEIPFSGFIPTQQSFHAERSSQRCAGWVINRGGVIRSLGF